MFFEKKELLHFHSSQPLSKDWMELFPKSPNFQTSPSPKCQSSNNLSYSPRTRQTQTLHSLQRRAQPALRAVPGRHHPRTWKVSEKKAESTEIGHFPTGISSLFLSSGATTRTLHTTEHVISALPSQPLLLSYVSTPMLQALSRQPACFLPFLPRLLFRAVHTSLFLSPQRQLTPSSFWLQTHQHCQMSCKINFLLGSFQ